MSTVKPVYTERQRLELRRSAIGLGILMPLQVVQFLPYFARFDLVLGLLIALVFIGILVIDYRTMRETERLGETSVIRPLWDASWIFFAVVGGTLSLAFALVFLISRF